MTVWISKNYLLWAVDGLRYINNYSLRRLSYINIPSVNFILTSLKQCSSSSEDQLFSYSLYQPYSSFESQITCFK